MCARTHKYTHFFPKSGGSTLKMELWSCHVYCPAELVPLCLVVYLLYRNIPFLAPEMMLKITITRILQNAMLSFSAQCHKNYDENSMKIYMLPMPTNNNNTGKASSFSQARK